MNAVERQRLGTLMTLVGGVMWGFSGCCGQYMFLNKNVTAIWLVSVRLILAGLLLVGIGLAKDGWGKHFSILRNRADRRQFLLYALFGITLNQFTYFLSVEASNAGTATVLQYVFPAVVLGFVCFREKRRPNWLETLAVCLVFFGVFMLGTGGSLTSLRLTPQALLWGFLSIVSVTVYNLLAGDLVQRYGIYSVLGTGMLLGAVVTLPLARPWQGRLVLDASALLALFGVIVLGTAIAYSFYLVGVSMIGPLQASLLACVEPVASVVISAVWLRTEFVGTDLIGFACILLTLLILSLPKKIA